MPATYGIGPANMRHADARFYPAQSRFDESAVCTIKRRCRRRQNGVHGKRETCRRVDIVTQGADSTLQNVSETTSSLVTNRRERRYWILSASDGACTFCMNWRTLISLKTVTSLLTAATSPVSHVVIDVFFAGYRNHLAGKWWVKLRFCKK